MEAKPDASINYTTADDVQLYIDMLKSSDRFMQENIRMHNSMTAALGKYLKFVNDNVTTTDFRKY